MVLISAQIYVLKCGPVVIHRQPLTAWESVMEKHHGVQIDIDVPITVA